MCNIAVIGLGNIGKRHLQSIQNSTRAWNVYGIDANQDTLQEAVRTYKGEHNLKVGKGVEILPEHVHVVVIATSSAVRREVFEQLVEHSDIDFIIFEKVLFQRVADYYYVQECLKKYNIQSWVNCARREQTVYQELRKEIMKNKMFEMHISGGEWELACNGIHMLDLIEWYAGAASRIDTVSLSDEIVDSKRNGYKEVYGSLAGTCGKCSSWSISCQQNSNFPLTIEVIGDYMSCRIIPEQKIIKMAYADKQWEEEEREFISCYQSQQTEGIVERILDKGICNLPSFEESMRTHLRIIEPLIEFFEKHGMEEGRCPIT